MDTFQVGEVVEIIGASNPCNFCYIGEEAIITGPLCERQTLFGNGRCGPLFSYEIRTAGGYVANCVHRHLRKKRPPEELTSWDSVEKISGWRPREPETIEVMLEKIADGFNKWKALEHP